MNTRKPTAAKEGGKPEEDHAKEDRYYDQGYAWVVAVGSFVLTSVVAINIVSFGVLLTEFALHFDLPHTQLSIIAAIRMGFTYCSGMVSGSLVHRFGCRKVGIVGLCFSAVGCISAAFVDDFVILIATFGFVAGFGAGLCYVVPLVIITKYFKKKRILATGVSSAGFSFGSVVAGLATGYIIQSVGWRYTLAIIAMLNVQVLVAVCLFFDQIEPRKPKIAISVISVRKYAPVPEIHIKKTKRSRFKSTISKLNFMDFNLLKNRHFLVFAIATFPIMSGAMALHALAPNRAFVEGVDKVQSSFVSAAVGCCGFFGRILSGIIGNHGLISSELHYTICVISAGVVMAISIIAGSSLSLHLVFAAMFGMFFGNYEGISPTVLVDYLGAKNLSKALGWIQLARGLCAFITLPLAGFLFDVTGGYTVPFLVMAALQISGGFMVLSLQLPCSKTCGSYDLN